MIITLNGFPINDGSNGVWLTEIDGLEMPSIRTSTGNYAGRDGGFVGAQYYSARSISIQGTAFSSSVASLETTRQTMQSALLGNSVTMNILTNAGNNYTIKANLLDFSMPIKGSLFSTSYKIELLAPDPTIYSNQNAFTPVAIPLTTTNGFVIPFTLPLALSPSSGGTTITNAGTVAVYPIITLTGVVTNPVLTNSTTGNNLSLLLTTANTDVIIINMQQRTVTLNGSNIFGDVATGSAWWFLNPGANKVSLSSGNAADTVSATITWQSGYIGI